MFQRLSAILWVLLITMPTGLVRAQTPVSVVEVGNGNLPAKLQLTGNVVAAREVDVGTEIAGQVAELLIEQGDQVVFGQPLVKLRNAPTRWRLTEAKAQLRRDQAIIRLAKLEEQRLKRLLNTQSVAAENYDQAVASLQQALASAEARKAEIARLEDNLSHHTIIAPFDGVITNKPVELGRWLDVGDTVVHLASFRQLRLELAVPQRYFQTLQQARNSVEVAVFTDANVVPLSARVERIVPVADNTRSFRVWIGIDNQQGLWIPGMSASATLSWQQFNVDLQSGVDLIVPTDALVRHTDGSIRVWKLTAGSGGDGDKDENAENENYQAMPVTVEVTGSVNGSASVSSDQLQQGDRVIVRGNETLQPGQEVSPVALGH